MTRATFHLTWIVPVAVALTLSSGLHAQDAVDRFTALAVNMNATGGGASGTVDITVTRWSTDAERDKLTTVLLEQGPDKLLSALRDMPRTGSISSTGNIGFNLRFARREPAPGGGERIVLLTDRPISFSEASANQRSMDYPFSLVELRLNAQGEGEGKWSAATKIMADRVNKTMVLENWSSQPVMLTSVKRMKK
jgi:hypothetical protein